MEQNLEIDILGPIWVRSEPIIPTETVDTISQKVKEICSNIYGGEFRVDLVPFLNTFIPEISQNWNLLFSREFETSIEMDWSFATTTGVSDSMLQIARMLKQEGESPRIYIDHPGDNWRLGAAFELAELIGEVVEDPGESNMVVLTHGTPELGLTSLTKPGLLEGCHNKYIILDAATEWMSAFGSEWKSIISKIFREENVIMIGDMQKVIGSGFNVNDNYVPFNLALMWNSAPMYEKRRSFAIKPKFPKSVDQAEHFVRTNTRITAGGIPNMNLIYAYAFFELYGNRLGELADQAICVGNKLRAEYNLEGSLFNMASPILPERMQTFDIAKTIAFNVGNSNFNAMQVTPTTYLNDQLYGIVQIYPALGIEMNETFMTEFYRKLIEIHLC